MTTYLDMIESAVKQSPEPVTAAEVYERSDLDDKERVYKGLNSLVKSGRLRIAGERVTGNAYRGNRPSKLYAPAPAEPDIDTELVNALKALPDASSETPEPTPEPEPEPHPAQPDTSSGEPILIAIDRLQVRPRIQGADKDAQVLYRLADKIGEIGNNPASDIAARLCEIAAKLEAAA